MAYFIKSVDGSEILGTGLTRNHIKRALEEIGLIRYGEAFPALPRFGRALVIAQPIGKGPSYQITHE